MAKTIICKDVYGNQYTVPVDELNIRVGVYAVIIEDNKDSFDSAMGRL